MSKIISLMNESKINFLFLSGPHLLKSVGLCYFFRNSTIYKLFNVKIDYLLNKLNQNYLPHFLFLINFFIFYKYGRYTKK